MAFQVKKNKLTDEIKSLDNKIVHKEDEPFGLNNYCHIFLDIGKRGSGKSSLALNLLKTHYKKFYDKIFLFSPTGTRDPKFDKLIKELSKEDQFYDEVSGENIEDLINRIEENNDMIKEKEKRKAHNLVIFDDCIHMLDKGNTKNSQFNRLITSNRHIGVSIWIMSQKYNTYLSPLVRSNADIIAFFKTDNKKELKTLEDDLNVDEKLFNDIYKFCCTEPHSFMLINMQLGSPIFYKKLDRILLNNEIKN